MRTISTSKGCRSFRSVDCGLRPNASETCLPAPLNFPFGEDHVSSVNSLVFTLSMSAKLGTQAGLARYKVLALCHRELRDSAVEFGRRGAIFHLLPENPESSLCSNMAWHFGRFSSRYWRE